MSKHPALQMSKQRQQVWLKEASVKDFMEMTELLARLYAKKIYNSNNGYKADALLEDYQKYKKNKVEEFKENPPKNNAHHVVPFASPADAPGSYVEKSLTEQTIDELMEVL